MNPRPSGATPLATGVDTTMVEASALEDWATEVLQLAGLSAEDGRTIARNLSAAEIRGLPGHGFLRLPIYLDRLKAGGIVAGAEFEIMRDSGALVLADGHGAPGQVTAHRAAALAVDRGRTHGVGLVIVRGANHFGAAAPFADLIADAGMVGVVACNTDPAMCGPGGGRRVLGTNPIAIAAPTAPARRPVLDMATSHVSLGKLLAGGEEIPTGWAVDAEGRPTASAADGIAGALLPAGGAKGFGLAFMIDVLLAAGGAAVSPRVSPLYGDPSTVQDIGVMMLALRADVEGFAESISGLVDAVHASGIDLGGSPVLFPGEPELERVRSAAGRIGVPRTLRRTIADLSETTGVHFAAYPGED